jgi:hypothetical protein
MSEHTPASAPDLATDDIFAKLLGEAKAFAAKKKGDQAAIRKAFNGGGNKKPTLGEDFGLPRLPAWAAWPIVAQVAVFVETTCLCCGSQIVSPGADRLYILRKQVRGSGEYISAALHTDVIPMDCAHISKTIHTTSTYCADCFVPDEVEFHESIQTSGIPDLCPTPEMVKARQYEERRYNQLKIGEFADSKAV